MGFRAQILQWEVVAIPLADMLMTQKRMEARLKKTKQVLVPLSIFNKAIILLFNNKNKIQLLNYFNY